YMRTPDEHTKLARVALEFMPDLDSAFDLNVAKARVNLPADLKQQLKVHVEQLTKQARKAYTPPSSPSITSSNAISSRTVKFHAGDNPASPPTNDPVISHSRANGSVGRALESAAKKVGEEKALNRIRQKLKEQYPKTAKDIGW
ncbi:MAG: hypothetical protein ACRETO_05945, partial [Gammaproteobacteria bacterium]